jgi:hypothetical protein
MEQHQEWHISRNTSQRQKKSKHIRLLLSNPLLKWLILAEERDKTTQPLGGVVTGSNWFPIHDELAAGHGALSPVLFYYCPLKVFGVFSNYKFLGQPMCWCISSHFGGISGIKWQSEPQNSRYSHSWLSLSRIRSWFFSGQPLTPLKMGLVCY